MNLELHLRKLFEMNLSGKATCKILSCHLYTQVARVGAWILMEESLMVILGALVLSAGVKE
jgi:hypothetical protein